MVPDSVCGCRAPRTLTLDDAALLLKTTRETISDCIRRRGLPAAKVGRAYVLLDDDVIAWLRTQYAAPVIDRRRSLVTDMAIPREPTAGALALALAPRRKRR